jgi:site-specific DNA recombinase
VSDGNSSGGKRLRAVGYCRTSSEAQRDNTSIPTQKAEIERLAARNGWALLRHYIDEAKSGAKIEGRDEFKRLMRDAANGQFDAVVVYDVTRFSRNGIDILNSARTLKDDFGVHVVDTKGLLDTRGQSRLMLYVNAGVSEDERLRILDRTTRGKLEKARRGFPTAGNKRPFGRTWDEKAETWTVDEGKKQLVEDVARRYLTGESVARLAKLVGMNCGYLHRVITRLCGPYWPQRVRCAELGVDETIQTPVPALLDAETIRAIHERAARNRTFRRGEQAAGYLLSRVAFCSHCGSALSGQTNKGHRYYRHTDYNYRRLNGRPDRQKAECPRAGVKMYVSAGALEDAVMRLLFSDFGNPAAVQRAVEAALPDCNKAEGLLHRRRRAEAELEKVKGAKDRLVRLLGKGTLTEEEAAGELADLRGREAALKEELQAAAAALEGLPTPEQIRDTAERVAAAFGAGDAADDYDRIPYGDAVLAARKNVIINNRYDRMTPEDARALLEMLFGGKLPDGGRAGVYVSWLDGEPQHGPKRWSFQVRGRLVSKWGTGWGTSPRPPYVEDPDGGGEFLGGPGQRELLQEVTAFGSQNAGC